MRLPVSADIPRQWEIDRILHDREIWDRITDDHCPKSPVGFHAPDMCFLGGYVDGEIVSLFTFDHFGDGYRMHFMVLKDYRGYARVLIRKFLDASPRPLYISIPSLYPEVINFAKNTGFVEFKIEKDSYLKNGQLYNDHWMKLWAL